MTKRAMLITLVAVGLLAWTVSAQTLATDALPKLDAIAVEASTVIEANVHLPKRQRAGEATGGWGRDLQRDGGEYE
jgi:hypothetical protein